MATNINENRKLKEGDKYLSGSIGGKTGIKFAVFKNRNKTKDTDPDYLGNLPIALWVNAKRAEKGGDDL